MKLLLMILSLIYLDNSKAFAFPQLKNWKNSPILVFENKKQAVLKKDLVMKSPFAVVTTNRDQLAFKVNTFDDIFVYEKSKIQILELHEETGFVADFYILDGQIRYTATHRGLDKDQIFLKLKTPFFDLSVPTVSDFIVQLDMKTPSVEIKMISGSLPVAFFSYEKQLVLKAGESIKFVGVFNDDKTGILYDYLLQNKKTPKGAMQEIKKFDTSQFLKEEEVQKKNELKKKKADLRKILEKKQKQIEYENSFLCKKPFANKDQCAWWLEEGKCFRKRCNVSGDWGEIIERPVTSICQKEVRVKNCDY